MGQIRTVRVQFKVQELFRAADWRTVESEGIQAHEEPGSRYLRALTGPETRQAAVQEHAANKFAQTCIGEYSLGVCSRVR